MKKLLCTLVVLLFIGWCHARAQSYELQRLILDIEKLSQLKTVLSDLYKGYEILDKGYTTIKNISEGNFNLHKAFLDGLLAVSPAVKNYKRVADIIDYQSRIVSEYKAAFNLFKQDKHFNPDEISYLGTVYGNLFNQSLNDLSNLVNVLTPGAMRMSDAERLHSIDGIYGDSKDKLMFLRKFNNDTESLAVSRAIEANDIGTVQNLYGFE